MKAIIIGGVAGGATAAARLRRNSEAAQIVLVERGPYISFANCGLPYHISGAIAEREQLLVTSAEAFHERYRVDVRVRTEAIAIDRANRTVRMRKTCNATKKCRPNCTDLLHQKHPRPLFSKLQLTDCLSYEMA